MFRIFAVLVLALPLAAQADTSLDCSGEGINVQVQVTESSASSVLKLNDEVIPALRACMTFSHGNSRIPHNNRLGGKWRCPHGVAGSDERFEVYPIVNKANGEANHVKVIRWDGRDAATIDLKDCR